METIMYVVLKFQVNRACFQREEASANFHIWAINRQQNKGPFVETKETQESFGFEEVLLFWADC